MVDFDEKNFYARGVCTNFYDDTYSVVGQMIHQDKDLQQRIRDTIKDKRVIELGCCNLLGYCLDLFAMGADSYVGVEPFHTPKVEGVKQWFVDRGFAKVAEKDISYVHRDAASYLQSVRDREGIVTFSSGLLEGSILYNLEYAQEVVREIVRLAKPNESSAIHVTDSFFTDLLQKEGLHLDFGREISSNRYLVGIYSKAQPK